MFTQKDILARLQKGEDVDAIANEFVTMLNAAQTEYAEAEKAKSAEARIQKEKEEKLTRIYDLITQYFVKFYPDSFLTDALKEEDVEPKNLVKILDDSIKDISDYFQVLMSLKDLFGENPLTGGAQTITKRKENKPDNLEAFLKANGLC